MIKQHAKIDKNYNLIEFTEKNDKGKILYKEKRTYNEDNSLKEVIIIQGKKITTELYKNNKLNHTTYPNGNTMIHLGDGRTIYWEKHQ